MPRGQTPTSDPRGQWNRIMTQLTVYYYLPDLISPGPGPWDNPDLNRSALRVCVLLLFSPIPEKGALNQSHLMLTDTLVYCFRK